MKDVKIEDLLGLWKITIADTSLFIAKWAIKFGELAYKWIRKFSKWLWQEILRFYDGATWVTCAVAVVCAAIGIMVGLAKPNKSVDPYISQIDSLNACVDSLNGYIDSIEVVNKASILVMKAGEYHITPHSDSSEITKDSVGSLLSHLNAWYPEIIMAQVQIESDYGKSNVARNSNNLVGMKKANKRITTQIKNQDYNGYGKYNNWESCIIDRVIWDYEVFGSKKPSREAYIEKLNHIYAESRQYGTSMDGYSKGYLKYINGYKETDTAE